MSLDRHNSDLDIPNENIVVCKDIDDILDDLNLSPDDREIYKDVIKISEEMMYEGFQEGLCIAIPYVCRVMKNAGRKNLNKNRKELFGNGISKLTMLGKLYRKPFDDAEKRQKEIREINANNKLEIRKKKAMKKNSKFKFNIGIETKLKVTDYNFRKNYVKPGTFQFVNKNGKNNT